MLTFPREGNAKIHLHFTFTYLHFPSFVTTLHHSPSLTITRHHGLPLSAFTSCLHPLSRVTFTYLHLPSQFTFTLNHLCLLTFQSKVKAVKVTIRYLYKCKPIHQAPNTHPCNITAPQPSSQGHHTSLSPVGPGCPVKICTAFTLFSSSHTPDAPGRPVTTCTHMPCLLRAIHLQTKSPPHVNAKQKEIDR